MTRPHYLGSGERADSLSSPCDPRAERPDGNGRLRLATANFIGDSLTQFERDPSTGVWSRKEETSLAGAHPAAVAFCDADGDRRADLLASRAFSGSSLGFFHLRASVRDTGNSFSTWHNDR